MRRASDPVAYLNAEVRGDGDPYSALAALCAATGWSVRDAAGPRPVDLNDIDRSGWRELREWRNRVFEEFSDGPPGFPPEPGPENPGDSGPKP